MRTGLRPLILCGVRPAPPQRDPHPVPAGSDPSDVAPYLHDVLYGAAPVLLDGLISQAHALIRRDFPALDPLTVLRQALG